MWLRWVLSNLLSEVAEKKARGAFEQVRRSVQGSPAEPDEALRIAPPECRVVVLFALGIESGALIRRMRNVVTTPCASFTERVGTLDTQPLVVAESGVGAAAARQATEDVIALHQPAWIVSAGFAGALHPALRRGHIVMPNQVVAPKRPSLRIPLNIDPEAVATNPALHVGRLLTVDHVVLKSPEKRHLAETYHALACDMETMAVAEACQTHQVRFLSVRVISDLLDETLPKEIEHLIGQQTVAAKLGAATRALFQRPSSVKDLWQLRDLAGRCAERLAQFLQGTVSQLQE